MILILIITLFALVGVGLSVRRMSRPAVRGRAGYDFDSAPFEGLFAGEGSGEGPGPSDGARRETGAEIRERLLERARQGDLEALTEAHAMNDRGLYDAVLAAVVARDGGCQERLGALVSHVVQNGKMRASTALAELMIENWEKNPDRNAAIEMLHISALSDDSQTFQRAMNTAFSAWSADRVDMKADELLSLIANEYWVLSPDARRSGESFLLKRRMSEIRRRLARRGSAAKIPPDPPSMGTPARSPDGSNATGEGENHEQ